MESMWFFFLQGGVGALTCLLSKFERDRQPREILISNSPPVIDCLVFWGMWAAREEGCWTRKELIPSSGESKLVSCCWWAMDGDGDGDGDCDGCMVETPWLGAETDWYLFLIRSTGDKSLYGGRRAQVKIFIWENAPFVATMLPSFVCSNVVWVRS